MQILCIFYVSFRAVGTFARALDCSSSIRQPSLHMSAAAASRDITLVRQSACGHTLFSLHAHLMFILFRLSIVPRHGHSAEERLWPCQSHVHTGAAGWPGAVQRWDGRVECIRSHAVWRGSGKIWQGLQWYPPRFCKFWKMKPCHILTDNYTKCSFCVSLDMQTCF